MSTEMKETARVQKPVAQPRRKAVANYVSSPAVTQQPQQQGMVQQLQANSQPNSNNKTVKTKPARPEPPKFRASSSPKPVVKQKASQNPSPPPTSTSGKLSLFYNNATDHYATAPTKSRRRKLEEEEAEPVSTTIINSRSHPPPPPPPPPPHSPPPRRPHTPPSLYINVAPKTPPARTGIAAARFVTKSRGGAGSFKGPAPAGGTSQALSPRQHKNHLAPTKSVPLSSAHAQHQQQQQHHQQQQQQQHQQQQSAQQQAFLTSIPSQPQRRQDFKKIPVPKKTGKSPARPAPPTPYHQWKKDIKGSSSSGGEEYAYVDLTKNRLPVRRASRSLECLDLSKTRKLSGGGGADGVEEERSGEGVVSDDDGIYTNGDLVGSGDGSGIYTSLLTDHVTENIYALPGQPASTSSSPLPGPPGSGGGGGGGGMEVVGDAGMRGPRKVTQFEGESSGRMEGHHQQGVYANVAPKAPRNLVRSKSYTLNIADSPPPTDAPHPTHSSSQPQSPSTSPELLTQQNVYTPISYDTKEQLSIYEVPKIDHQTNS